MVAVFIIVRIGEGYKQPFSNGSAGVNKRDRTDFRPDKFSSIAIFLKIV